MEEIALVDTVVRLTAASLLAAVIGVEREIDGQDAGLRTHMMLALGAALFGLASVGAFNAFAAPREETNVVVDVTRIASYVAPGIGFIGGGAILKTNGHVQGLTTASSLWVAAAVGLTCGLGYIEPAAVASVIAVLSLAALRPVRNLVRRWAGAGEARADEG